METVESGMALRNAGFVSPVSCLVPAVSDSGSYPIGLITPGVNGAGARSAVNPHATCDVAGVGNGIFAEDLRASARPYREWVQSLNPSVHDRPRCVDGYRRARRPSECERSG